MVTPKNKRYDKTCQTCGIGFTSRSYRARFCSAACKQKEYRKRKQRAKA